MNKKFDPTNLDILILDKDMTRKMGEVTSRDIFEQNSTEFNAKGLFSTTIFGSVGSKERMTRFGYINIHLKILHPRAYKEITSLSSLYKGICEGKKYAKYDPRYKDFVETDRLEGKTGFNFFIEHMDKIDFKNNNNSTERLFKIEFIKKYKKEELLMDKFLVIPAGLREYILTESGKPLENEINNYYRKVLAVATTAKQFKSETKDNEFINTILIRLQNAVTVVYDHLENMLDGKSKFIQGKWTKRSITYGTRNVITGVPVNIKDLKDKDRPGPLSTILGVYQASKGLLPITIFQIRTKFLHDIFDQESTRAMLIDPKDLKRKPVNLSEKYRARWVTDDGLEETINKMDNDEIAKSEIVIDKYYLMLIYDGPNEVRILKDIDQLPQGYDPKYVRPMTYLELIYLSLFDIINNYPGYITRYPITGYGSIVPSYPYLKTTLKSKTVNVYLPGWVEPKISREYPLLDSKLFISMSIPTLYLNGLGADFDGDKVSFNFVWKEESRQELLKKLKDKSFYVDPSGGMPFSPVTDVNIIILKIFTE